MAIRERKIFCLLIGRNFQQEKGGAAICCNQPSSEERIDGKNKTQHTETTNRTTQHTEKKHKKVNERRVMEKCYEYHVKILNLSGRSEEKLLCQYLHCDLSNQLKAEGQPDNEKLQR